MRRHAGGVSERRAEMAGAEMRHGGEFGDQPRAVHPLGLDNVAENAPLLGQVMFASLLILSKGPWS